MPGGDYELTIFYTPAENRGIDIYVNGDKITGNRITLHPGFNKVEISSNTSWVPDIDKFELKKIC